MRNFRAAFIPLLMLVAICALAGFDVRVSLVAHFDFIWDVLLGAVLGIGFVLLPSMAGFSSKRNAYTSMFWVCGFVTLLLIFYQYMTLVTGMRFEALSIIAGPDTRMRVVEGAMLGYCSFFAGRGKA